MIVFLRTSANLFSKSSFGAGWVGWRFDSAYVHLIVPSRHFHSSLTPLRLPYHPFLPATRSLFSLNDPSSKSRLFKPPPVDVFSVVEVNALAANSSFPHADGDGLAEFLFLFL